MHGWKQRQNQGCDFEISSPTRRSPLVFRSFIRATIYWNEHTWFWRFHFPVLSSFSLGWKILSKSSEWVAVQLLSCFPLLTEMNVGPLWLTLPSFFKHVAYTNGTSLCLVPIGKSWFGRITLYFEYIKISVCFLEIGRPRGTRALSSWEKRNTWWSPNKFTRSLANHADAIAKWP